MAARDTVHVVCPHCDAVNRAPAAKLVPGARGKCGKCARALFAGAPIAVDAVRLRAHAGGDLPLVVDFWAAWCGPCRTMAPHFERVATELEPRVRLAKVDTEAAPALAAEYGIRSIPTLVLLRGGREIARHSGAMDSAGIRAWVERHL
ncbi:MAG: thioredoxin TrxC [Gammaproteobacteria bacterium]|nr:thioredoxin TrxC [Gammaproteobacteria bacterium]